MGRRFLRAGNSLPAGGARGMAVALGGLSLQNVPSPGPHPCIQQPPSPGLFLQCAAAPTPSIWTPPLVPAAAAWRFGNASSPVSAPRPLCVPGPALWSHCSQKPREAVGNTHAPGLQVECGRYVSLDSWCIGVLHTWLRPEEEGRVLSRVTPVRSTGGGCAGEA